MKNWGVAAFLFLLLSVGEAKKFNRCELLKVLKKAGLDKYAGLSLGSWICFTYYQSKFNTRALGGPNKNGARNYGIFQINSHWWCTSETTKPNPGCNVPCKNLTNDDITDDIACLKKIVSTGNQMDSWTSWRRNCKGRDVSRWTKGC